MIHNPNDEEIKAFDYGYIKGVTKGYNKGVKDAQEAIRKETNEWLEAYPISMFTKPDLKKAAKVLKENGMTLDGISADCFRWVLNTSKERFDKACKDLIK